jgi:ubiquinone/menaquinone biosynthesis C-methylase UbiE
VIRRLFKARPKVLDPLDAYELWAATYDDREGNALLYAEQRTVCPLLQNIDLSGKCVLDAGCGTGRYLELLRASNPSTLAGIDFAPAMLKVAKTKFADSSVFLLGGRIDSIPFADRSLDFVLSTLALDHLRDLHGGVSELARVLRPGGAMVISLFHPNAKKRGWQRTFRTRADKGHLYAAEYYGHDTSSYLTEFETCGLGIEQTIEPVIDESLKPFYERAARMDLYEEFKGLPLLLVFRLRKR